MYKRQVLPRRLLLLLAAAVAASAFAAPAGAQLTLGGVLLVQTSRAETNLSLGGAGAGIASATILVPPGYDLKLDRPAGTQIGRAALALASAADPEGTGAEANGSVVVGDPRLAASDPRISACAPGVHLAAWRLEPLDVPVLVDRATGPQAALGGYELRICPSLRAGLALRSLSLDLQGVVVAPALPGLYVWRALLTPRTPSGGADPGGTYEARSIVPWPSVLTLRARRTGRGRGLLYGRLLLAGRPRAGATVEIIAFTSSIAEGSVWFALGRSLEARTDRSGRFRRPVRVRRRTMFVAAWLAPPRETCSSPSSAPAGCVSETTSPALSERVVVLRPG
jgi:hypothetical protein